MREVDRLANRISNLNTFGDTLQPKDRSFYLDKMGEEVVEIGHEDTEERRHEYLQEHADLFIAQMTLLLKDGIPPGAFIEAIDSKIDLLWERLYTTEDLMREGVEYNAAYLEAKAMEKLIYTPSINQEILGREPD